MASSLHQHLRLLAQTYQSGDGQAFSQALVLMPRDPGWGSLKSNPIQIPSSNDFTAIFSGRRPCPSPLIGFLASYSTYLSRVSWADDSTLAQQYSNNALAIKQSSVHDWELLNEVWDSAVKAFGMFPGRESIDGGFMGRTMVRLAETLLHAAFRSARILQDARSTAPSNSVDKVRKLFHLAANTAEYSQDGGEAKKGDPAFALGNMCWRVYDQLRTYRLFDTVSQTYDQMRPSIEERLLASSTTKAERVGYWYWCGKLRLAKGEVREARDYLVRAFEACSVHAARNLRAISIRLAVCQILLGHFPSRYLLSQFDQAQPTSSSNRVLQISDRLVPLMSAIQTGDRAGYHLHLTEHGEWFRRRGLWLVLREKGELLVWRGLFRNTFAIWSETNPTKGARCTMDIFLTATRLSFAQCGETDDVGLEDVVSILTSLIDQSYIKGYISSSHQTLVMPATTGDPYRGFPALADVRPRTLAS